MKKVIILSLLLAVGFNSCKKDYGDPSMTVTVAYPTITLTGAQYYSITVNGALPTIAATAYDSFYNENCAVILDLSTLDATTPGLYAVTASAANKYGFVSHKTVYVGVTNEPASFDISGTYVRGGVPTKVAFVSKVATGMFLTSNVGGDDTVTQATSIVPAVFVVTSDTTLDFGTQLTNAGTLTASSESLMLVGGGAAGTTLNYAISLTGFGTSVRTFVKQ
jgi:hypothetical protein